MTSMPAAGGAGPPYFARLIGVETRPRVASFARAALGDDAEILAADARSVTLPAADVILLFDVLHLMPADDQEAPAACTRRVAAPGRCARHSRGRRGRRLAIRDGAGRQPAEGDGGRRVEAALSFPLDASGGECFARLGSSRGGASDGAGHAVRKCAVQGEIVEPWTRVFAGEPTMRNGLSRSGRRRSASCAFQ